MSTAAAAGDVGWPASSSSRVKTHAEVRDDGLLAAESLAAKPIAAESLTAKPVGSVGG